MHAPKRNSVFDPDAGVAANGELTNDKYGAATSAAGPGHSAGLRVAILLLQVALITVGGFLVLKGLKADRPQQTHSDPHQTSELEPVRKQPAAPLAAPSTDAAKPEPDAARASSPTIEGQTHENSTRAREDTPTPAADNNNAANAPQARGADSPEGARDVEAWRTRGNQAIAARTWAEAIASYDMVIALEPTVSNNYNERGRAFYELKRYERARNDLTWALALAPDNQFAKFNLGLVHLDSGRHAAAQKNFADYIAQVPDDADGWSRRGRARQLSGDKHGALQDLSKALSLKPKDTYALVTRCAVAMDIEKPDLAEKDCKAALEIDPSEKNAHFNLGMINLTRKNYAQSEADFSAYLKLDPNDAEAWMRRGAAHFERGDYRPAITDFTRALELNPKDAFALTDRCGSHIVFEEYDLAEADCKAAIELKPDMAMALNNIAWLYYKLDRHKTGIPFAERAVAAAPDDGRFLDTRAHLLEGLGEKELAISDFREALKHNPGMPESIAGLKRLGVEP